ncbi:hypothetical protein [Natronobeatus ordinarius]|uniref:hypothetical protein n=1 Tax=Natronobeatus ordinarius TaxID=2963433 RepID=UPI0020CBB61B|nr:hypothetical protein [Natronobeatus ordinarius]
MAREPSVADSGETERSDGRSSSVGGNDGVLHRRSYLKLAGTAAAGIAASAMAGTAAASEDYEVIKISAGRHETIFVGDNEVFENKIIDVSADGAQCSINSRGNTNWTIRNVGFRGAADGGAFFGISESDPNGTSVMENIYIGDGTVSGHRSGLGVFLGGEHEGTVEIKRTYIEGMGDNSFYCSSSRGSGEVHFENCYSKNSWVAHYRLARGSLKNCVAVNDGNPRSRDQPNHDGRGVWLWNPGPVEVEDCHFAMGGRHYSFVHSAGHGGGTIHVRNTQWDNTFNGGTRGSEGEVRFHSGNGNNPRDFVPEGCPTSAEEAASGGGSSGGAPPRRSLEHTMRFDGEPGAYFWQVHDGPIEPVGGGEKMWVSENGRYAAGVLEDGEEHRWAYDSFLADIEVDDGVDATINDAHTPSWDLYPDEDADPRDWYDDVPWYGDDDDEEASEQEPEREHTMTFDGEGAYFWQVHDGPIEPVGGGEKMWVSENGRYAAGVLEDGEEHRWAYDSFLADIEVEDDVDATINGAHTPTWSYYPDEGADPRDWYDDVPWYDGGSSFEGEHTMTFDGEGAYFWQVHDGPIQPVGGGEKMWVSENGRYAAGVLEDGEEHQWAYDSFLADIEVDDGVDATINGAHTPTWSFYPDEDADPRDWYDDVPW